MQIFAYIETLKLKANLPKQIEMNFDPDRTNSTQHKNKVLKVGAFFSVEKVAAKQPSLPCKAPQNDHQNTTNCTTFSQNPSKNVDSPHHKKTRNGLTNLPIVRDSLLKCSVWLATSADAAFWAVLRVGQESRASCP
jgi:hypothetical protein